MGAGAWQRGAERKLGEREKPSEVLNFPSTKSGKKKGTCHVSRWEGGRMKAEVGGVCVPSASRFLTSLCLTRLFIGCWGKARIGLQG